MKHLFEKLKGLFGLNEGENEDQIEQSYRTNKEDHGSHGKVQPEVQVRTKTVYPKEMPGKVQFRFPVIPDEKQTMPKREQQGNRSSRTNKEERTLLIQPNSKSQPQLRSNPRTTVQSDQGSDRFRNGFKPSEVISPIYGRNRPEVSKTEEGTDRHPLKGSSFSDEKLLSDIEIKTEHKVVPNQVNELVNTPSQMKDPDKDLSNNNHSLPSILDEEDNHLTISNVQDSLALNNIKATSLDPLDEHKESFEVDDNIIPLDSVSSLDVDSNDAPVESIRPVDLSPVITKMEPRISFDLEPANQSIEPTRSSDQDTEIPVLDSIGFVDEFYYIPNGSPKPVDHVPTNSAEKQGRSLEQESTLTNIESPRLPDLELAIIPIPENPYHFPRLELLREEPAIQVDMKDFTQQQIEKLTVALQNFNVHADVVGVVCGPTVTRYELQPAPGVKVNKFTNLVDDIKLALAAKDIRMEAPIPGRSAIGIEVPNEVSLPVFIRSILASEEFQQHSSPLAVALGRDISGAPVIGDLQKMPHGLIAGSTGSGKSVCINSILISLLYKAKPSEVRLILIDPKVVELAPYNHIPHLLTPVVTDPKQATAALKWAVEEMEKRYEKFAETGVRDIARFNKVAEQEGIERLPYILIVIDELADLMMVSPHDVEESICRIAQKARACGIHLLVATQRPSVDVITGLIKANIPTRVAFSVSSSADSRTILDMGGAERLLGKGDMLYYPSGLAKPLRLQGNFVSDEEIEAVVDHVKSQQKVKYIIDKEELTRSSQGGGDCDDELFEEALLFTIEQGQASSSSLQRRFRIGYNRAARLIDMMESEGFITGQSGSKPRDVLLTLDEYQQIFG